ncbi:MAG: hypothetical protein AAF585_03465 [Verrucomicrobiota bacterium]
MKALTILAFAALLLGSCRTNQSSEDVDQVAAVGQSSSSERELFRFFGYRENGGSKSSRILFSQPGKDEDSINTFLLGGTFLPGTLEVKELVAINHRITSDGVLEMDVESIAEYVGIPPNCQTGKLRVKFNGSTPEIVFKPVYCNWVGIGNVIYRLKLNVNEVNLKAGYLAGSYRMAANGTANGIGSGKFVLRTKLGG